MSILFRQGPDGAAGLGTGVDVPRPAAFLRAHGEGLRRLAEAIGDAWLCRDAEGAADMASWIDPPIEELLPVLARLRDQLEALSCMRLQQASAAYPGRDIDAARRWHGARLSELLAGTGL